MQTTRMLARFIVNTQYADIDPEAIRLSKRHFLDWLGAAIIGYTEPGGKIITRFVEQIGGTPDARLLGSGIRTSLVNAALVNGTLGHIADFDDSGFSHPTASLLPVLLALGEKLDASGEDILLAQNIGYECFGRFYQCAKAYELVLRRNGIHPNSLWGTLAAAIASAKLLKLDETQTAMAMGLAASQAAGLIENFGTMTKGFHCGDATRAGLLSALLVQMGYEASQTVLEGDHGFYHALIGAGHYDLNRITEGLGKSWLIVTQGIDIKRHPSCAATLRAIEATLCLVKEHKINSDQVESVEVRLSPTRRSFLRFDDPCSGEEAKFSMGYAIAAALVDGDVTLDSYAKEKVCSDLMKRTVKKVRQIVWDEAVSDEVRSTTPVTIRLTNGKEYSRDVLHFPGSAKNPLSDRELHEKFRYLASRAGVSEQEREHCMRLVLDLEHRKNVRELIDTLIIE